MKHMGLCRASMLLLACLGMMLPTPVLRGAVIDPALQQRVAGAASAGVDVELHPGGVLLGQVVDVNGIPLAGTSVSLRLFSREVATTVTNESGYFRAQGLRGGTYEILAGQQRGVFRIWAAGTAPPSIPTSTLVVLDGRRVRGQGPIGYWLGNPWVIAGLVAVAVAVPLAIHNNRMQRSASP